MTAKLDSFDMNILKRLTDDGRISWRDLADEIGLSLTPTLRRVRQLESEGYILGYAARLDEKRLIGSVEALISITLDRQTDEALTAFETSINNLREVTDCFQITGEFDYLLRVVVLDLDHYQPILTKLSQISVVSRINSSFVLKTVMRRVYSVP
ncbi:Lrp/AsnC family transcriptional regulator [Polymorphobacter fuscus]|uniref:Winged helix-turn-helix transcriptional regulator n=1 Tax=Sandarakinorhabdus fusca TaxID=1439888 RepID=A0A7C9GXE6_9SPHN|nr:Lrp/AsnC family transcriptional regulator [Polymorphobacter fuscus]KAB7647900.1 Lrp/AsnC family transcriptional regulator [Polymorphobacter fuscus]MQT17214.1 winged helix-turn-helix transcriptional regulator [Polymorphobacter fuscus]NJC08792.1 DNA-binding Lrp family transcriptional regulator [Polymorphobacter fuscus]